MDVVVAGSAESSPQCAPANSVQSGNRKALVKLKDLSLGSPSPIKPQCIGGAFIPDCVSESWQPRAFFR
jgi:hypothetical protein